MSDIRLTNFGVLYDLTDVTANEDSTAVTSANKDFADITMLNQNISTNNYSSIENNYFILDGTKPEFPDNPTTVVFFNSVSSDENGEFDVNPVINISFDLYHSSFGLTFYFDDTHPLEAIITWKNNQTILYRETVSIDSNTFVVYRDVQLYNNITVEFTKTFPNHYIKLQSIKYGIEVLWDERNVKTASLVQEMNTVGDKLSVNTLSFDVIDVNDQMNPGNASGMHNYYQKNQVLYPYEMLNGEKLKLGKFFLSKFSNSTNLGKMSAVSYVGLLDATTYDRGQIYNGALAGDVLTDIFQTANIHEFEIDEITYNQSLYGTIKPNTCRNALQNILFACGSIVDNTVDNIIKITKPSKIIRNTITRSMKFNTSVTKNDYYSTIEIQYSQYSVSSEQEESEILTGHYEAGIHKIAFSQPYASVTLDVGTILEFRPYYVVFELEEDSDITLTGITYVEVTNKVAQSRSYLDPGEVANTKSFTTTLCNFDTARQRARELLEYYKTNNITIQFQSFAEDVEMNDGRIVENPKVGLSSYIGHYTSRNFNLTGGFVDTVKLMGYFDTGDYQYFGPAELFAYNGWDTEIL